MSWQTSSRSNRVSFWFLIILGILAVAAVGLVLYRFNGDMGRGNGTAGISGEFVQLTHDGVADTGSKEKKNVIGNGDIITDDHGRTVLNGTVLDMLTRSGKQDLRWITFVVTEKDGSMKKYSFVLDANTEIDRQIVAGDYVAVHFFGEPLESESVIVGAITDPVQL